MFRPDLTESDRKVVVSITTGWARYAIWTISGHFQKLLSDQTLSQRPDVDVEIAFGQITASENVPI
jgi:hypothetical protein